MTILEINQLIDKYLEGKTSPEEEQRLALEVNRADAPQEWLIIREMLGELTLGEAKDYNGGRNDRRGTATPLSHSHDTRSAASTQENHNGTGEGKGSTRSKDYQNGRA